MSTVVIGLDGASFELIDPWIEEGALPNIARIKQEGVWGDMTSVLPPVTSPNWKCFSTGKNPGKIGIFWWENIDWYNRKVYYPADRKSKNKEIWDYIGEAGMKVGVIGMPTTYPPKKVNGFLVSGGPDAGEKGFTYPPELEKELKERGWEHYPQHRIDIDKEKSCHEIDRIIVRHFETAYVLWRKYDIDFLMLALFRINNLHHFLWNAPETKRAWQIIDSHIGEFVEPGCDVIIMSDHGSNKIESVFNINTWLKEEGYLKLNPSLGSLPYRLGVNQQSLARFASRLGGLSVWRKIVPKSLLRTIPAEKGELKREAKASKIDWQKSQALASGQGPIYLNPKHADKEALRKELKQKLEALVNPSSRKRVIEKVYYKEEIYHGKYLVEAPDLIVDQARGVHIPSGIGHKSIFDSPGRWQAENKKIGLFMAYGPNIKKGQKIHNISILDLAPTILHLLGLSIPNDMDGRVIEEIFQEGSGPANTEVRKSSRVSESQKITQRVLGLKEKHKI